jgi:SAM-dependent methyltransferase
MTDPLAGSSWSSPDTVAGFVRSPPNETLLGFARRERQAGHSRLVDLGCGAGRNAIPLAEQGWTVAGTDLSWPMLAAAADRAKAGGLSDRVLLTLAPMDQIPFADQTMDFVVAHGIWNLARSGAEFRRAVREAARIARPGAALFVFTFSRSTLPADAQPVPGESFVFTQFSGQPQCFLTNVELFDELGRVGFSPDAGVPFSEYNRPPPGSIGRGAPVIYEAGFRRD